MSFVLKGTKNIRPPYGRAVQVVSNPFSQGFPQLELYYQLKLSLSSDPFAFSVPKSTYWLVVKIQCSGNLAETQMKK